MKIYLDNDFKCHLENDGTMLEFETDVFENKCKEYIEGYRIVPQGESWTRSDGEVFHGMMVSPCRDYSTIESIQNAVTRETNLVIEEQVIPLQDKADCFNSVLNASSVDYPIPHKVGDKVIEGHWYACQNIKALAIKTGNPVGMTDTEYFSNWQTF